MTACTELHTRIHDLIIDASMLGTVPDQTADDIMDLIGPKELVWGEAEQANGHRIGRWRTGNHRYQVDRDFGHYQLALDGWFLSGDYDNENYAKAAAQAHHDKLWWEGMK